MAKQILPGNSDANKKEFLADVSSFANASGGDIVFGLQSELDEDSKDTGAPGNDNDGYCQLFFNGVIESVFSDLIRGAQGARPSNGVGGIASLAYERDVIQAVGTYLKSYRELGIVPPIAISMALLGCKGSFLYVNQQQFFRNGVVPIDRDAAILPDVVIDELDVDVAEAMKPIFDAVWNACGYARSFNYNEAGEWSPQR